MAAQKPRREQLCPRLAKVEVGEKLLTEKMQSPKAFQRKR